MKLTEESTFLVEDINGKRHFRPVECDDDWGGEWQAALRRSPAPKDFEIPYSTVLRTAQQLSLFIDLDPDVLGGSPRIKDTRIPVYGILKAIEEYGSINGAAAAYRSLTPDMIRDALRFAANILEFPVEHDDQVAD